jgi:hypothetical protein
MPIQIPTYISKTAPGVIGPGATSPASTGLSIATGLQSLAGAMQEVELDAAKKVGDAARLGEFVARKGQLTDRIGQLDDSLSQDPDHRTYFDRAKKGIEEASTEALSGISDPALKNALLSHVSSEKDRYLLDARHKARVLTIDFTRGALENSIDQNIKAATSSSDASGLIKSEGDITSAVAGAVSGGIWTAEHGEKIRKGAQEKIYTALAMQMADQEPVRFLSNYKEGLYKDTVDPIRLEDIRRYAEHRSQAVDASAASTAVWEQLGPKRDEDPINEDLMVRALEAKFVGDPQKSHLAIASLKEKVAAHDKGTKERRDANLSNVWKASLAGAGIAQIVASPEYAAMDGNTQRQVKEHLEDRSWTLSRRAKEVSDDKKAAQHELYWRYSQPEVLDGMTDNAVTALYPSLGVELTDKLMATKRNLEKPAKLAEAKIDQDDFNHFARAAGLKPEAKGDRANLGEIKYQVENAIDAEQQAKKRVLSREEKAKIMKRGLVEVDVQVHRSFLNVDLGKTTTKKRIFDVQYPGNISIPKADRDKIAGDLSSRGLPVTDDNIYELFLRMREK